MGTRPERYPAQMWADYLAAVLPGLADVPIQRLPELTSFAWANRHRWPEL